MANTLPRTALPGRSQSASDKLASGLGWFSIALGAAELFAPRALSRWLGMEGHENLIRAYGAREIATGIAILGSHDPQPWVWGRVGGDGLDLATLATGLHGDNPQKGNVMVAMAAVAGVTAIDVLCANNLTTEKGGPATANADYSDRSGFPRGVEASRGLAKDVQPQNRLTTPETLRAFPHASA
jgi:hypothetical protein